MDVTIKNIENSLFFAFCNHIPYAVFVKNINLEFIGCNNLFAKQFGFNNLNEIVGKTDNNFPWPSDKREKYKRDDLYVIQTGKSLLNMEEEQNQSDHSIKTLLVSKIPYYNSKNEIIGVIGFYTDITEKKAIENKLIKANKIKSEFIANMSHDLRTPITGMVGMIQHIIKQSEKLEKTTVNSKIINAINEDSHLLMEATEELLQLFNQILETMNLESGELIEDNKSFKLSTMIEHNVNLLTPVAKDKNLKLSCNIDSSIPTYFDGLYNCLDRVLLNLLTNAIKFTDSGFVKINVELSEKSSNQLKTGDEIILKFEVEDSGKGIPEDKIDTIFDLFTRLTPSYEGVYKGAGMGLHTVKEYLKKMNGDIAVKSEVNKGTCFTITVPLIISDHSDIVEQPRCFEKRKPIISPNKTLNSSISEKNTSSTRRVLLVEDNAMAARASQIVFEPFNLNIDIARNGAEAVEKAKLNDYCAIFMDIGLPDFDGIEATRRIREFSDSKKAQVPIIALTGHARKPDFREKCMEAKMQDVIDKPPREKVLETILNKYIVNKENEKITDEPVPEEVSFDFNSKNFKLPSEIINWDESIKMAHGRGNALELLDALKEELDRMKPIVQKAYIEKDYLTIRDEIHRCLGGVCYLKLPQLEFSLKALQQVIWKSAKDEQIALCFNFLLCAIENFYKI